MRRLSSTLIVLAGIAIFVCQPALSETRKPGISVENKTPAPEYRIYPLRNGICKIAGNHAFHGGDNAETYDFALYIWLIHDGDKPILVDAGLTNVVEMNRGAAHVLREPITPNEQACRQAMAKIRSLADIVLPAHDPLTLQRWPNGIIGAKPDSFD